jgi:hypothetical protein
MQPKIMNYTQSPRTPLPRISLIIPFESRMNTQAGMNFMLSAAADKAEKELMKNYVESEAMPVIKKLRSLIKNVKHNTHNQSIAIFVSSLAGSVYYFKHSGKEMSNYR